MKISTNYIDSEIIFTNDIIQCIEIENKTYFYRFINDLFLINQGINNGDFYFYDEKYNEINMNNRINVIIDYFNIDFNSKKYISFLNKNICESILEEEKNELIQIYKKFIKKFKNSINNIDIEVIVKDELDIESIIKLIKIEINSKNNIFENLLLLIDIEKVFKISNLIVFVNLKQYLNKEEIIELYKYSIYNNIKLLLIDSQSYGVCLEFEKKVIIDENLEEFVI